MIDQQDVIRDIFKNEYEKQYISHQVIEWESAYFNYSLIKLFIRPFQVTNLFIIDANVDYTDSETLRYHIFNITDNDINFLNYCLAKFWRHMRKEQEKVIAFYNFEMRRITREWIILKLNSYRLQQEQTPTLLERKTLQQSFLKFYKKIKLLLDFLVLNQTAAQKIIRKVSDYNYLSKGSILPKFNMAENKDILFILKHLDNKKLLNLQKDVEIFYLEFFIVYNTKKKQRLRSQLDSVRFNKTISLKESLFFGIFLSCILLAMLLVMVMMELNNLSIDKSDLSYIFPAFRGIFMIIMYYWLLGFNIAIWNKFNINYKEILKFNTHYSRVNQIFKRASLFSAICLFSYLLYVWMLISRPPPQEPTLESCNNDPKLLEQKTIEFNKDIYYPNYIPLVPWFIFLICMIFPSKKKLNGQGRIYIFKRLLKTLLFFKYTTDFPNIFIIDQILSFVFVIKDICYLTCFYSRVPNVNSYRHCKASLRNSFVFMVGPICLSLRMIHAIKTRKKDGKIVRGFYVNMVKFPLAIMVPIVQYIYLQQKYANEKGKDNDTAMQVSMYIWIVLATIASIFMFCWDTHMDWGLIQKGSRNKFLRNELAYSNKNIYYGAICLNLILRSFFVATISPDFVENTFRTNIEVILFLLGFAEQFRRFIWNYFRIEVEHLKNMGDFKAIQDLQLPYPNMTIPNEDEMIQNQLKQFEGRMNVVYMKNDEYINQKNYERRTKKSVFQQIRSKLTIVKSMSKKPGDSNEEQMQSSFNKPGQNLLQLARSSVSSVLSFMNRSQQSPSKSKPNDIQLSNIKNEENQEPQEQECQRKQNRQESNIVLADQLSQSQLSNLSNLKTRNDKNVTNQQKVKQAQDKLLNDIQSQSFVRDDKKRMTNVNLQQSRMSMDSQCNYDEKNYMTINQLKKEFQQRSDPNKYDFNKLEQKTSSFIERIVMEFQTNIYLDLIDTKDMSITKDYSGIDLNR